MVDEAVAKFPAAFPCAMPAPPAEAETAFVTDDPLGVLSAIDVNPMLVLLRKAEDAHDAHDGRPENGSTAQCKLGCWHHVTASSRVLHHCCLHSCAGGC